MIVWEKGNRKVDAEYRTDGEVLVFIYTVGPRGGKKYSHSSVTPGSLRREARRLMEIADAVEAHKPDGR